MLTALTLLAALTVLPASAGNEDFTPPGEDVWHAPFVDSDAPVAFAVHDGVGWILFDDELRSTDGERLALPYRGRDISAGADGVWVLTERARFRLEGSALLEQPRSWSGHPLEIAGDGAVMSAAGVGALELSPELQSPWAAQHLRLHRDRAARRFTHATWEGERRALPGDDIVDARPIGSTDHGVVLALTDSADRSAQDGVRFVEVSAAGVRQLDEGLWSGDALLHLKRAYAWDPVERSAYALVVDGEQLSLRRY